MMDKGLSLNIGCGATKIYPFRDFGCDVNVDICIPEIKIPNYVICDALHIPFRPIFSHIIASNIVEHLPDPNLAIEKFKAIAKSITIIVPHPLCTDAYLDPTHKWVWTLGNWRKINPFLHFIVKPRLFRKIINFVFRYLGLPRQVKLEI